MIYSYGIRKKTDKPFSMDHQYLELKEDEIKKFLMNNKCPFEFDSEKGMFKNMNEKLQVVEWNLGENEIRVIVRVPYEIY